MLHFPKVELHRTPRFVHVLIRAESMNGDCRLDMMTIASVYNGPLVAATALYSSLTSLLTGDCADLLPAADWTRALTSCAASDPGGQLC